MSTNNSLSLCHSHTVTHTEIAGGCSCMPVLFHTTACPPPHRCSNGSNLFFFFSFLVWLILKLWFEFVFWLRLSLEMFEREKIWKDFVVSHCKYWVKKYISHIWVRRVYCEVSSREVLSFNLSKGKIEFSINIWVIW